MPQPIVPTGLASSEVVPGNYTEINFAQGPEPMSLVAFGGTNGRIITIDFTGLVDGGMSQADFLAATGLTYTRSGIAAVQTGLSTAFSGLAADTARIGSFDGIKRGLSIGPGVAQLDMGNAGTDPRAMTGGSWQSGSGTTRTAN
jgi:hypothetical protein